MDFFSNQDQSKFLSIQCPKHPQYQIIMLCICLPCTNRGPICPKCLMVQHNDLNHTFSHLVLIDDALAVANQYNNKIDSLIIDSSEQLISISNELNDQLTGLNQSITMKLKLQYDESLKEFKDKHQISPIQNEAIDIPEQNKQQLFTPRDDGPELPQQQVEKILNFIDPNRQFVLKLKQLAQQITIVDGELTLINDDQKEIQKISQLDSVALFYQNLLNKTTLQMKKLKLFIETKQTFGFIKNMTLDGMIKNGWKVIYEKSYSHKTTQQELQYLFQKYNQNEILTVLAYDKSSQTIPIMAIDTLQEISTQTISLNEARESKSVKGLYWYNVANKSFGFSDQQLIQLQDGDCVENGQRLSWNLNGDGGFRVSDTLYLHKSNQFSKIILIWEPFLGQ